MAKECICCRKKIGLLSGEHFGGKICDECFTKFGGYKSVSIEGRNEMDDYLNCYNSIAQIIDETVQNEALGTVIKELFFEDINSKYNSATGLDMPQMLQERKKKEEIAKKEKEKELQRIDYANSFNEFYEYDVETIINANHGMVDKEKMKRVLAEYSKKGYRLHTIYSNELGKNAISLLGFGVNATACEDVLIFERRIKELE